MNRTPSAPTVRATTGLVALAVCSLLLAKAGAAAGVPEAPGMTGQISPWGYGAGWDQRSPVSWLGSPLTMGAVMLLMAASAVGIARRSATHGAGDEKGTATGSPAMPDVAGAAARVADCLEAGDDPDEVYAAWLSMLEALSVRHPESCSAERFAREAETAGLEREDVDAVVEVYEVVRYGGAATDDRQRRAVETLRSIAERYGTEGAAGNE